MDVWRGPALSEVEGALARGDSAVRGGGFVSGHAFRRAE